MMRATAEISRILRGVWARDWAAWRSSKEEKRQANRETTEPPCPVGPCLVRPAGPVGLSACLQIAGPITVLQPASPLALRTPFEVFAELFCSANHVVRDTPVDPYPFCLSRASLHRTSDEIMMVPALGATATRFSLLQSFAMTDVCQSGGKRIVPAGGWNSAVRPGVDGSFVISLTQRVDVRRILAEGVELYASAGHGKVRFSYLGLNCMQA